RGGLSPASARPLVTEGLAWAPERDSPRTATHGHGAGARPAGTTTVGRQPRQRSTSLAPAHFPRLAMGRPSISMMSRAKLRTGALAIEVPTPYASATGFSERISYSST